MNLNSLLFDEADTSSGQRVSMIFTHRPARCHAGSSRRGAHLAFVLLVMHSLTYGFAYVLDLGSVDDPDVGRYELALAVGIGTNVFGALGLSRLTMRTRAAAWPPVLAALPIALVTGVVATTGMLAVLGFDPLLPFAGLGRRGTGGVSARGRRRCCCPSSRPRRGRHRAGLGARARRR